MYRPIFPIMLFPSTSQTFPILLSSSRKSSQFHFWKDFSGVAMVDHPHMFNTEFPLSGQFFTNPGSNQDWLVVYLPLWKIWVRQLGYVGMIIPNIWKVKKLMFQITNQENLLVQNMSIIAMCKQGTGARLPAIGRDLISPDLRRST